MLVSVTDRRGAEGPFKEYDVQLTVEAGDDPYPGGYDLGTLGITAQLPMAGITEIRVQSAELSAAFYMTTSIGDVIQIINPVPTAVANPTQGEEVGGAVNLVGLVIHCVIRGF